MTAQDLRRAVVGYPESASRAAVVAGLLECPLPDLPVDPGLPELVAFWLTDPDAWEWLPPPLTSETIAAIYRRLHAAAN
jgi:hypothetical protein